MTSINEIKRSPKFEIGDVIEVSMRIEHQVPSEDEEKSVIDLSDYATRYEIDYSYPRELGFLSLDFTVAAGCISDFKDDIEQYLAEYLRTDLAEIADYELIEVDIAGEYQTAKIRIKHLQL